MYGKAWTEEQLRVLVEDYSAATVKSLAEKFGRSAHSVMHKASRLGLCREMSREWTTEETRVLVENYHAFTAAQIGERLNRSPRSIIARAFKIGLCKRPQNGGGYYDGILGDIKTMHEAGLSDGIVAHRLGVKQSTVSYLRRRLIGIKAKARSGGGGRGNRERYLFFAIECGWPAEWGLRLREAQILNLLACGPMTRRELADAIGVKLRKGCVGTGRSTMQYLMNQSLIVCVGGMPRLYQLSEIVINYLEGGGHARDTHDQIDGAAEKTHRGEH